MEPGGDAGIMGDNGVESMSRSIPIHGIYMRYKMNSLYPFFNCHFLPMFDKTQGIRQSIRLVNPGAVIIVRAHQINDALELYKKGASYVLTPHFLGGEYISKMITDIRTNEKDYKEERDKHIKDLTEMMKRGHEHPLV